MNHNVFIVTSFADPALTTLALLALPVLGQTAITDLDYLVEAILGTVQGDGDLNRTINFQDFVLLSTNFSAIESGWAQGNFNLDSRTDFMDFVLLTNNYGTDLSSRVSAQAPAPEPTSLVLLSLAISFVAKRRGGNGRESIFA